MSKQPKASRGVHEEQGACARETTAQAQETEERPQNKHPVEQAEHELQEGDWSVFTANRSETRCSQLGNTEPKSSAQFFQLKNNRTGGHSVKN